MDPGRCQIDHHFQDISPYGSIKETNRRGSRLNHVTCRHGRQRVSFFMVNVVRAALKAGVFLAAFVALFFLALALILPSRQFREWLQGEISERSGYEVRAASLSFHLPMTILAEKVEVTQGQQLQFSAGRISASLNPFDWRSSMIHRLAFDQPLLEFDIDEITKPAAPGSAAIALRHLDVHDGKVVLKRAGQTVFEVPSINLTAQNMNLAGPSGITLHADVPQLDGAAELQIKGQLPDLVSELSVRPRQSKSLFENRKEEGKPLELLHMRVTLRAPERKNLSAAIESRFNRVMIGARPLTGTVHAQLTIDPAFVEANFSGRATLADFPQSVSPMPLEMAAGTAAADFAGNFSLANKILTFKSLRLATALGKGTGEGRIEFAAEPRISAARFSFGDIPLESFKTYLPAPWNSESYGGMGRISLSLQGPWHAPAAKGTIASDAIAVRSQGLAVKNIAIAAPFDWTPPRLHFSAIRIRASQLAYTGQQGWRASADRLQIDGALDYQAGRPLTLNGRLEAGGAQFSSPDSSRVGENLNLDGSFVLHSDGKKNASRWSGQLIAASGELLWGKFYGDLKNQKPALAFDADYFADHDRLECRRCELNLVKVGRVKVLGGIDRAMDTPLIRIQANSTDFSPGGFFDYFLRETFNRQYPVLDTLAIDGQAAFGLQIAGHLDALTAAGELSLKDGDLRSKTENWRIGPISLMLPLQIYLGKEKPQAHSTPRIGKLTNGSIRFTNQRIPSMSTAVSLANNALRFHQPIHIRVFGGDLTIGDLFWPDVINNPKQLSFSLESKLLKLDDLTQAMDWPRFSGTLSGSIPQVESVNNLLHTRGEMHAELFGGQIRLAKLEIDNPFSALASIKLDAELSDIQLEQVSKTFAFGRISGTLEGSIDGLVVTDGQPSELRADLHSVDRGGEQRISVQALNKITVLSSGQEAGALYGGLATFFDSFRYSKLGFKATLKNDRLTLRGVESRGDQQYLVVGSFLPPTVNVVSHTQIIAFSELLRRLERINKADKPSVK